MGQFDDPNVIHLEGVITKSTFTIHGNVSKYKSLYIGRSIFKARYSHSYAVVSKKVSVEEANRIKSFTVVGYCRSFTFVL